jgi:hypothetical protein
VRRIFSVFVAAAVMAAMLVATALPAFADPVNSCKSHSFEFQCSNTEPSFVLNHGACEAFAATRLGGQAARNEAAGNPSLNDHSAHTCNPDAFPPPPA